MSTSIFSSTCAPVGTSLCVSIHCKTREIFYACREWVSKQENKTLFKIELATTIEQQLRLSIYIPRENHNDLISVLYTHLLRKFENLDRARIENNTTPIPMYPKPYNPALHPSAQHYQFLNRADKSLCRSNLIRPSILGRSAASAMNVNIHLHCYDVETVNYCVNWARNKANYGLNISAEAIDNKSCFHFSVPQSVDPDAVVAQLSRDLVINFGV